MHKLTHRDFACIFNMLESIDKILKYSKNYANADDFNKDSLAFDATMMNFIIIGEMVEKLSEKFLQDTSAEIDWFKIKGFRNIIAHNYFGIDAEEVWQIINISLPHLRVSLENHIK